MSMECLRRFTAFLLIGLLALGLFNASLLVANYQLNKQAITEAFCVNKEAPVLKCEGKCHLAKQLKKNQKKKTTDPSPDQMRVLSIVFLAPSFGEKYLQPIQRNQIWRNNAESLTYGVHRGVFRPPVA